ncbi:MAG: hypothetical protein ACTHPD_12670 [Rhizomicrobium sp.]
MSLRNRRVAILLSAVLLAGCAANVPVHGSLDQSFEGGIASTDIVVPIKQGEIFVFVPDSQIAAAGGGGLLLALVDAGVNSVRTSKAEAAVKPLRDSLADFDFDGAIRDNMKSALSQVAWLHVANASVVRDVSPDSLDRDLAHSSASDVVFVNTTYMLSNDANLLTVSMSAGLFSKDDAVAPKKAKQKTSLANSIYHNHFTFLMTAPKAADRDHYIAEWSAHDGAAMRAALKRAAEELPQLIADDLQNAQLPDGTADGVAHREADGSISYDAHPTF